MKETIDIIRSEGHDSPVVMGSVENDFAGMLPEDAPRVIIVTDAKVHSNNLAFINSYEHIVIGQGESAKTFVKLEEVYRQLLAMGADRSTFIVGMGGGIVSDVTGFVAATYMRGVRFAFIPTTLLAQVDASIGGKNGVNLDGFKNIIGVFRQPEFVLCDPRMLATLPEREFRAGLSEVIKAGVIGDPQILSLLEQRTFEELRGDGEMVRELIRRAIRVKTFIVNRDECERGERRKLNLGHTFAHAIEKSFSNLSHGEAVAAGMAIVCNAARRLGKLGEAECRRIVGVIERMGLPVDYPDIKKLLSAVRADKKREGGNIYLVYPYGIGDCRVERTSTDSLESIFIGAEPVASAEGCQSDKGADAVQGTPEA